MTHSHHDLRSSSFGKRDDLDQSIDPTHTTSKEKAFDSQKDKESSGKKGERLSPTTKIIQE
jgi:hypothetical protein